MEQMSARELEGMAGLLAAAARKLSASGLEDASFSAASAAAFVDEYLDEWKAEATRGTESS